ncbi:MAG TPA: energy transducer TonB [Myxococcota bacterium]|nr:energy transducer TonB [Myxococcota bacterium]
MLGFLRLMSLGAAVTAPPAPLDARFVEIGPPEASAAAAAPAAPPDVAPRRKVPAESRPRPKPEAAQRPAPASAAPETAGPAAAESGAETSASAARSQPSEAHGGAPGGSMSARALYKPLPEIPERLRRHDVELVAVARFLVAADGTAQVELIEPTSEPSLNQSLLVTLRTWRFFPALEQGRPVASTIDLRIPISVR